MDLSTIEPKAGELYGHLFENATTGCPLGIYWAISVPFTKSSVLESFGVEWLSWPVRRWPELDGSMLRKSSGAVRPEASCYCGDEHQEARLESVELARGEGTTFVASVRATLPKLLLANGAKHASVPVSFSAEVTFLGIDVLPDNLAARPRSAEAAARCVAEHLDVDDFVVPTWEKFKYVLRPRTGSA